MSDSDTYIKPALAWRCWLLPNVLYPQLCSVTNWTADKPDRRKAWHFRTPFEATCGLHEDHSVPDIDCNCGLYGTTDIFEAVKFSSHNQTTSPNPWKGHPAVIGLVKFWGEVIEYSRGYRAQFAYPHELWIPKPIWKTNEKMSLQDIAEWLSEAYGVPCSLVDSYRDIPDYKRELRGQHIRVPELESAS